MAAAPAPGSAEFYRLPLARRQEQYQETRYASGGQQSVPMNMFFSQQEIRFIEAASMPTAAWADQVKTKYPTWASYLNIPEVGEVLKNATLNGWQPPEAASKIQATDWWRTHSDTQRSWYLLNATDPAAAAQALQSQLSEVTRAAQKYGVFVAPSILTGVATQALASGWDQDKILQELVQLQTNSKQPFMGVMGATRDDIRKVASDYMMPLSDHTIADWTRRVVTGSLDSAGVETKLRDMAKSQFADPQIQKSLDDGQTMRQIADPYTQMAATTLSLPPSEVDYMLPKYRKALSFRPDATQPSRAMSLDEWRQTLETDDTYGYDHTDQAKAQAAQLTTQLGQAFGVIG